MHIQMIAAEVPILLSKACERKSTLFPLSSAFLNLSIQSSLLNLLVELGLQLKAETERP